MIRFILASILASTLNSWKQR